MSNLLVDLGNARLKWALSSRDTWQIGTIDLQVRDLSPALDGDWAPLTPPQKVLISNVAGDARLQALQRWVVEHWSTSIHVVRAKAESLGVKNTYRDPGQLGADRWAAIIAARGITSTAACVVDCGTAVTLDALSAEGEFVGGVIFPGLNLLRDSLIRGTKEIRTTEGDDSNCFARATADGVAAGTVYGLAGAIERVLHEFQQRLGDPMQVFLTGGDAPRLEPRLGQSVTHVPDLVLRGLAHIAATL